MIILDPEEQVRCKEIIKRDTHLFEAGRQDLQAIFSPWNINRQISVAFLPFKHIGESCSSMSTKRGTDVVCWL